MITFTQKEVEDLIDGLLLVGELSGRSGEGLFLAHKVLSRRLRSKVNEQVARFEKERGQDKESLKNELMFSTVGHHGPSSSLRPTILYPVSPHSTEPEVD